MSSRERGEATFRVLVVDDEVGIRDALARRFLVRGHAVRAVSSGAEAIAAIGEAGGRFDLVILDLWMPGMNGLETLQRIRAADPWVPLIAVSGMGTEATPEACRKAGATGFLSKPFSAQDIEDMISEAEAGAREGESVARGARPGWRGRVLVADDHEGYRTAVARRIRLDGFDVDEVGTGAEAALAAQGGAAGNRPYDALLLDIHMPGGDGLLAAEEVRTRDPFLPILFMSGEATASEMREGLSRSTAGCLRKPVEMEKLGRMLEFLIESSRKSRKRAAAKAEFDARPASERAALEARAGVRRLVRSRDAKQAVLAVTAAVVLSILFLWMFNEGHLATLRAQSAFEGIPSPGEMYREITGYLRRDEERELRREGDR